MAAPCIRDPIRTYLLPLSESWPAPFYAGMFLVMFEVMNLFDDGHSILHFLHHAAKNILQSPVRRRAAL